MNVYMKKVEEVDWPHQNQNQFKVERTSEKQDKIHCIYIYYMLCITIKPVCYKMIADCGNPFALTQKVTCAFWQSAGVQL